MSVALGGQPRAEALLVSETRLGFNVLSFAFPVDAEGRIGYDVVEVVSGELVVVERVTEFHVLRVAAAYQHIRLGDTVSKGVQLLSEGRNHRFGIQLVQALLHTGQHLARAHRHVVDGLVHAARRGGTAVAGYQQIAHRVNDVAAGEVRPCLFVVTFREPLDQIFEDCYFFYLSRQALDGQTYLFFIFDIYPSLLLPEFNGNISESLKHGWGTIFLPQ